MKEMKKTEKLNYQIYSNGTTIHFLTKKKISPIFFKAIIKSASLGSNSIIKLLMKSKEGHRKTIK